MPMLSYSLLFRKMFLSAQPDLVGGEFALIERHEIVHPSPLDVA